MEFILIPLALIMASAGGILFIVWRKLPHLEGLTGSEDSSGVAVEKNWRNVIYDLCPEVVEWVKNIKVEEYKETWLIEMEKLLRRLRVVSLKMDRFSSVLIKKIRNRAYSNGTFNYSSAQSEPAKAKSGVDPDINGKEDLKKTEQKLILEIAKNPKNAVLYEELGDLYAEMGDYRDAKESYEAAIELNSNNEELKKKLSQALKNLNPQN